jgi:hypothetical protein
MKFLTTAPIVISCIILGCAPALAGGSGPTPPAAPVSVVQMGNVFVPSSQLPVDLKRVVMLPPACSDFSGPLADGCQMLGPVLQAELIKAGKFEVVTADPETLRNCTGNLSWTGEEALPLNFFDSLRQYYGCDAVLFCHLTEFRSSAPLAIGWRLKLVDAKTGRILWAADEIYDAKDAPVAKAAQRFEKQQQPHQSAVYHIYSFLAWCINTSTRSALDDQWNILHSPRYFGEFSAAELLKTLPAR